ncbi:MAG: adenine deaminase, partial [Euryarchaeota archaeon]|nr:adenine deaminase [Euryarchaeota archaeon]
AVVDGSRVTALPLRVAGLMSTAPAEEVAEGLERLNASARALGCRLSSPLLVLSFLALPVIPKLRLTDRGLFDAERFEFTELVVE